MDDEDHLAAAAFNVLSAMLMEDIMPDMNDLPLRKGKKHLIILNDLVVRRYESEGGQA